MNFKFTTIVFVTGIILMSFMFPTNDSIRTPDEPTELTLRASGSTNIPVEQVNTVQELELENNKGYLRLIVLRPLADEMDYGAYETAYLVYENPLGRERRHSIYEIGNIASVYDFKQVAEDKIEFKTDLYAYPNEDIDLFDIENQFTITVDLTDVFDSEERHYKDDDGYTGGIDGAVDLTIQ